MIIRYSLIIGGLLVSFLNFVSCGAKMYRVSLEKDHDPARIPRHASDQNSKYYGLHASEGWKNDLPVRFKVGQGLSPVQLEGLTMAMKIWEKAVGQDLFEFAGQDEQTGDSFPDLYGSLRDQIDGHYIDANWDKTGKPEVVLATTIWDTDPDNPDAIRTADIRYNAQHYLLGDAFKEFPDEDDQREMVDMTTLALHELGHLLGLSHISEEFDSDSIMNPTIYIGEGLANRRISCHDVKRIQKIYGCAGQACELGVGCAESGVYEGLESD